MVADTSLMAYCDNQEAFTSQKDKVFNFIKSNRGCTDMEIAEGLGLNINCVNGRRNQLVKSKKVETLGKITSKHTGRTVYAWDIIE